MGCFVPQFKGGGAIDQRPLDAVACCALLLLMCTLFC